MDQLKDSTWLATASFRKSGFHLRSWFWQLMRHAIKSLHGSSFRFGGGEGVVCIFFMIAFVMSVVNHFLLENKRNLQRNSCCTATLWRIAGTGEDGSKKGGRVFVLDYSVRPCVAVLVICFPYMIKYQNRATDKSHRASKGDHLGGSAKKTRTLQMKKNKDLVIADSLPKRLVVF